MELRQLVKEVPYLLETSNFLFVANKKARE